MEKRDLKADLEQLKRTKKVFEPQQVTFETPEDEIVPAIDILDQQLYTLVGLGEFAVKYGEELLERAIKAETLVRELLYAVDTACRLASDYKMEAKCGVAVTRGYTKQEQYRLISDIVRRAEEVLDDEF